MGRNVCGHPREVLLHLQLASLSRDPMLGLGVGRGRLQTMDICSVQQLVSRGVMLRDPWGRGIRGPDALWLGMSTLQSLLHARGLRRTCCPRTVPLGQGSAQKTASEQRLTASRRSWIIRVGSCDDGDRPAPRPHLESWKIRKAGGILRGESKVLNMGFRVREWGKIHVSPAAERDGKSLFLHIVWVYPGPHQIR